MLSRMAETDRADFDVEARYEQLAREHPSDDYYERSPWPIRFVEQRRLAIIRDFMGDVAGLDVLEVGSGGGHVLRMFPTARLTALDVADAYLELARKNLAGYDVRFVKSEVEKSDLPEASFDRIICTEVLEHVIDPDSVLAAIAGLLRPTGVAVVTVPNDPLIDRVKHVLRRAPLRWLMGDRIEWGGEDYHLHRWTPSEFERLLSRHLRVVERRTAPVARDSASRVLQVRVRVGWRLDVKRSDRGREAAALQVLCSTARQARGAIGIGASRFRSCAEVSNPRSGIPVLRTTTPI